MSPDPPSPMLNKESTQQHIPPQTALRGPEEVMRLQRMGSFFPTRLSFLRTLLRTLEQQRAVVEQPIWQMDERGHGHAVYSVCLDLRQYSLVAFSTALDDSQRSDRVIATAWDSTFILYDGIPDSAEIERLRQNAPRQEAGRYSRRELVLSRANKSVRLFNHVVDSLSGGRQPNRQQLQTIGYLMRTTAVYGNGKFGIADRDAVCERSSLNGPFQLEMLTVWLIREYTIDLVEHVARCKNPDRFVTLNEADKRFLGIGNSTGLGMAPFLVNHPMLLSNWAIARETALARVRAIKLASQQKVNTLLKLMQRAKKHLQVWNVDDERQQQRILLLRSEFQQLCNTTNTSALAAEKGFDALYRRSLDKSLECQELMVALLLEPNGDLIDGLAHCMGSDEQSGFDASMCVGELQKLIEQQFGWALALDFNAAAECAKFWYVSEEKLEPRIGNRHLESGAEVEMPLDIARRVQALSKALSVHNDRLSLAEFLLQHPQHKNAAQRVQINVRHPYSEIRDNLIADTALPIDMLRFKLSFFGASRFDPRSDLWTRITLFSGAPMATDVRAGLADDSWLPVPE